MPVPTDIQERIRGMEAIATVDGLTELDTGRVQRVPRKWHDPVRAGVAYFRLPDSRMPRGRIELLQNGQNALERVMYRGQEMLARYGGYHGAGSEADWQFNDKFLAIIMDGGLHEFDREQIVDLFWHYRPGRDAPRSHRLIWEQIDRLIGQGLSEDEAVLTVMPQIDGVDRTPQTCEACGPDRYFRDAESVRRHRSVMHPDDVQTVGTREAIAQAISAGSGSAALDKLADAMAAMVEQNRQLMELLAAQNAPRRGRPPASE